MDINRTYLPLIAAELPDNVRQQFVSAFQRHAYGHVYPDPLDPTELYEQIVAAIGDDAERQAVLQAMRDAYLASHTAICRQMEEASDDRWELIARTLSEAGFDPQEYRKKMRDWRDRRWMRTGEFIQQVESLLSAEVLREVKPGIDAFRKRMAWFENYAATDSYPR